MKLKFRDSAEAPIIAWDFDGTININGEHIFPECGVIRRHTKEVMNLLHDIGIRNVIWTSRDIAYNQDDKRIYDHLSPMLKFLDDNGIKYDTINKSVQFAPYCYNGRKVYAHLYVDDRAFGWKEHDDVMLDVLNYIMCYIIGINDTQMRLYAWIVIQNGESFEEVYLDKLREYVKRWKD